jgi:tRNA modification GTPase
VNANTIFALSSGAAPCAIAVIRISGPASGEALQALAGKVPAPRRASTVSIRDSSGATIDRALVIWFPGPGTATGEDVAELHCHGGRAVVAAVEAALAAMPKLRRATPGEFTRLAFSNGRIDLAEAEGLADLLASETELQRRSAIAMVGGSLSRQVGAWRESVLRASAAIEAQLDFSDDDDVGSLPAGFAGALAELRGEIGTWLSRPRAEVLREGFCVVIAGQPNSGKSTLFNALVESEAAITAPIAGTTRDVLMRTVAIAGVPFKFVDTAGLRESSADPVEVIGIARAKDVIDRADQVLWLGDESYGPAGAWEIEAQIDRPRHTAKTRPHYRVSAMSGAGLEELRAGLLVAARRALPQPGEAALNERQHRLLANAVAALDDSMLHVDILLVAEELRSARVAFDSLLGRAKTEDMLDTLFARFCIGK